MAKGWPDWTVAVGKMTDPLVLAASSTTPLGISGTWTSPTLDMVDFSVLTLIVKSDVAGTLFTDYSGDGVNWDYSVSLSVSAGVGTGARRQVWGPYARLRYVNGAVAQSYLRLYAFKRAL